MKCLLLLYKITLIVDVGQSMYVHIFICVREFITLDFRRSTFFSDYEQITLAILST